MVADAVVQVAGQDQFVVAVQQDAQAHPSVLQMTRAALQHGDPLGPAPGRRPRERTTRDAAADHGHRSTPHDRSPSSPGRQWPRPSSRRPYAVD